MGKKRVKRECPSTERLGIEQALKQITTQKTIGKLWLGQLNLAHVLQTRARPARNRAE